MCVRLLVHLFHTFVYYVEGEKGIGGNCHGYCLVSLVISFSPVRFLSSSSDLGIGAGSGSNSN